MRVALVVSGLSEEAADMIIRVFGEIMDDYEQAPWVGKWKVRLFEDEEEVRGM